ncbi:hypothetical protein LTR78_004513 [Recurvomyces mirabilis]|uniref:Ubiquitin-conjugating enzyme E2-binding protein n=1 Tax=Recurvomyces mirabilis TaxID=574656 RepID=A0AAE1C2B5_9PEZI|nr:hypothetical protein LTR78_004513 [Recurvomyces mirabilis]KAK5152993.1 hypothetical protein LTS14_008101 [Recurvomyces mirabilis]
MSGDHEKIDTHTAPTIHLYAEHLQNIRTLSIQASLATVSNQETRAKLSADGSLLTLQHEGESASIQLPLDIGRHSDAILTIPAAPTKELSFRLSVQEKADASGQLAANGSEDGLIEPWTASDMTAQTEMQCAACNAILVPRGEITRWKDLPSEGWAEMMEFWHCHKPDAPQSHDHSHGRDIENAGRGFAANSTLAVRTGVGLVGPTEFLLAPDDCKSIEPYGRPHESHGIQTPYINA